MSKVGNHNDESVFRGIVAGILVTYKKRGTNVNVTRENWNDNRLADGNMSDPPIVSFIRMSGLLQKTDRRGPHNFTTTDGSASELWFTAHYEDIAVVECHMTGHDRCETERLWNDVIHAVRETLGQMAIPTSYTWPTETEDGAAHIQADQHKVIQTFEWRILVPHDSGKRTEIKSIETEPTFESDDGLTKTVENVILQVL